MRQKLFWFFLLFPLLAAAQDASFIITQYSLVNGLPDNSVQCITQDRRGYLWIGTKEGLSRFDGRHFKNYLIDKNGATSYQYQNIQFVKEYKPDSLLILSQGQLVGLNTRQHSNYQAVRQRFPPIYAIQPATHNGFFLCTLDSSILIDSSLQSVRAIAPPTSRRGTAVQCYILSDNLWLVSSQWEHFLYNPQRNSFQRLTFNQALPPDQSIFRFHYFSQADGLMYFSNFWTGLYAFDLNGKMIKNWQASQEGKNHLPDNHVLYVVPSSAGKLWVGTDKKGIQVLDLVTGTISPLMRDPGKLQTVISDNLSAPPFLDRSNNIWIPTEVGLFRQNNRIASSIHYWLASDAAASQNLGISSMAKGADGNLYLADLPGWILYRLSDKEGLRKVDLPAPTFQMWSVRNDGNRLLISGAGKRILRFDPISQQTEAADFLKNYFPTSDIVVRAFKDRRGQYWYSGNNGGGLVRLDTTGKWHVYRKEGPRGQFSVSYYPAYAEDGSGDIWFGVNKSNKLLHYIAKEDRFEEIAVNEAIGQPDLVLTGINAVAIDLAQNLWLGLDGNGIIRYDRKSGKAEAFSIKDGLAGNFVFALQVDGSGRLWAATSKGLSCLPFGARRFVSFRRSNGLPEDVFDSPEMFYDNVSNQLYVPGYASIIRINPDSLLATYNSAIGINIDEVIVNGQRIPLSNNSKSVTLQPGQNAVHFIFSAVDIENGSEVEYSYRLQGVNDNWVSSGFVNEANFAALAPGSYKLEVRARHVGEEQWKYMPQSFEFSILPAWYQTWWFRIVLLLLLSGVVMALVRFYLQQKLQAQRIKMEMDLAVEQERNRLARELHDGLGSMLSGIKHSFAAIQNQLPLDTMLSDKFQANVGRLNESIRELRQISHSMSSASLQGGLEASIRDYCRDLDYPDQLTIDFESLRLDELQLPDDKAFHVFRIVQELIQNVLKHAEASVAIVQLSCNNQWLYITVEDNGKGFNMQGLAATKGMGLKNVRERVQILGGKMEIQSETDKGTSIMIEIPVP